MKISLNWLKQHVPGLTASVEDIVAALPMVGLEVESVDHKGLQENLFLVVGEILSREQHPNADRLGVCMVKTHLDEEPRQIVCGATNYKVGDRVPVALPGCVLGEDFKIKKGKLRGVESNGMMCSGKEIGLGEDHEGLLILAARPEVGTPMHEVFADSDVIIELELTANRGDCMSHIGVARELAAIYGLELKLPQAGDYSTASAGSEDAACALLKSVEVTSADCPYYTAYRVQGVKVAPSPQWLKDALEAIGLRPINNVVDITNYVLHETGQPLHAFDAAKIRGKVLKVRNAKSAEGIVTLDEKKRSLTATMTVIADNDRPLVVAGVMGSIDAEVDDSTTDIVLESAYFRPGAVRAASRRLALFTDSSQRFSRDVDPAGVAAAAARALDLIVELAGGKVVGAPIIVGSAPRGDRTIELSAAYVAERCGFAVEPAEVEQVFRRLGFGVSALADVGGKGAGWSVTVPSFRPEVDRPIDLVEEFIRIYGTENIPQTELKAVGLHRHDAPLATFSRSVSDFLVSRGFYECSHYSLVDGKKLAALEFDGHFEATALDNPLTSEMSHLRTSLIPGLLEAFRLNQSRGNEVTALFETGRIFRRADGENAAPFELASVAFVLRADAARPSWQDKGRAPADFFTAKALAEEIARFAGVRLGSRDWAALEHPLWQQGHSASANCWIVDALSVRCGLLDLATLAKADVEGVLVAGEVFFNTQKLALAQGNVSLKAYSDFPPSEKDIAVVVHHNTGAGLVEADLVKVTREALKGCEFQQEGAPLLFDVYQGAGVPEGFKSLAFTLRFRSPERTLNEKEVADAFERIQTGMKVAGYALRTA